MKKNFKETGGKKNKQETYKMLNEGQKNSKTHGEE